MAGSVELMDPPPATRGRRRSWGVAVVVIVLALAAVGYGAFRWLTGERLFVGPGATESMSLPAGQTIYIGMGPLPPPTHTSPTIRVDLRSAHPIVTTNSSGATVTVLMCIHATAGPSLIEGGSATDPHPFCGSVESFRPGAVTLGARETGLVLAVTPHRAGTVEADGLHVSYRVGIRSGSQHVGAIDLSATTP